MLTDSPTAAADSAWQTLSATNPVDIVILANGPGEVATWVKPVVQALHQQAPTHRISVILSPCPHASGQEPVILHTYPEVNRVQSAPHFFKFLLTGKTADNWDWRPNGVVVFLGGDQLYTVLVAKRLGYRTVTYAEWEARWPSLIDRFGVMQAGLKNKAPERYQHKFTVVGDLMADVHTSADRETLFARLGCSSNTELVSFLPGSKPAKLSIGFPFMLTAVQRLYEQYQRPVQVIAGIAPNLSLADLMRYCDPETNDAIATFPCPPVTLVEPANDLPYLQLTSLSKSDSSSQSDSNQRSDPAPGPKIILWQRFPALDLFSQCELCFTTVGANTAQLGALAIPMIVLLPTQRLGALQLADGLPGLLSRAPGVGTLTRKVINPLIIAALQKSGKLFAWPNIWAKREVVPELFGPITPEQATNVALDYLNNPEKLAAMKQTLRELRGPAGAANKLATLILQSIHYPE